MKLIAKILKQPLPIIFLISCCYSAQAYPAKDAQLEAQLMTVYSLDMQLNPFNIEADVIDGIVMLTGTVENDIERELAELLAKSIDGIVSVDNRLEINPDVERSQEGGDFARALADISITARVKSLLLWNADTYNLDIEVSTENARVTLTGTVGSSALARQVEQTAHNTNGVRSVVNELQVTPPSTGSESTRESPDSLVSDAKINSRIVTALLFDRRFIGSDIEVTTEDGIVLLEGTAVSAEQRSRLISMVRKIFGVQEVRHEIDIVSYASSFNHRMADAV